MAEIDFDWVWLRLKHSLQALAMSAEVQISLFPDYVGEADELSLDFANFRETVVTNDAFALTATQRACLDDIDIRLAGMSDVQHAAVWTRDALASRAEWQEIRQLATDALAAFGWAIERPPSYTHEFVQLEPSPTQRGGADTT